MKIWGTLDPFVENGDVMGRKVANTSFLMALLQANPFDGYHFFLENEAARQAQEAWLEEAFPHLLRRGIARVFSRQELHRHLARTRYHAFHLSDCLQRPVALARLRNVISPYLFPITSLTHSLSYERFMPGYFDHLWGGVSPRDSIIVTSQSARAMLSAVFAGFRHDYGLAEPAFIEPRLDHIPLGILTERHNHAAASKAARQLREAFDLGDSLVFLTLARISPFSKMDILPALAAFKRAEALGLPAGKYVLVVAGWAEEGDPLPESLARYAATMGIRFVPVLRPSQDDCRALYAMADVFLSPSDNIQETFGLTLAEAGAAGLPVIASDFDGYRDIVEHETTGLLVPTLGFSCSDETNVLAGLWFDNQYHLKLAQQVAVDVPVLAEALMRLGTDVALRRCMGDAARMRIVGMFSWEVVLSRYCELWDTLAAEPITSAQEAVLRKTSHPLHMDFARCFSGHFSSTLTDELAASLLLRRTPRGDALYKGNIPPLRYSGMEYMLDEGDLRRLLLAARKPINAARLMDAVAAGAGSGSAMSKGTTLDPALFYPFPGIRREQIAFALLWALKHDYLERVPE